MSRKTKLWLSLLIALLLVVAIAVVACDDVDPNGKPEGDTATYSVTVSKAQGVDVDLAQITAQWKSGGDVKASKALDADGKASVELAKGNYTVTLSGEVLANLQWTDASVTSSDLAASITLSAKSATAISYSVSVTCNDSELNLATLAVQWVGSEGAESCLLGADGTASINLEPGDYTVTVIGFANPSYYTVTSDTVSADDTEAQIVITAIKRDVAVTVESPVDLPNDVKIQVKDGGESYGEPVAINSEKKATVVVPYGKAVTLELVGMDGYSYITSTPVSVEASAKTATISVSLCEVNYTITVKAPDGVDVDSLTVTLLDGSDPVAEATNLVIEEGVATVTLLAGEYTVVLNGLNETDYKYEAEALTITKHSATVTITEKYWTISPVDAAPTVIGTFEDESEVKRVKLKGVEHSQFYAVLLSSDLDGDESEFNLHDFTIVYGSETFTVGKTRLEQELDSFIVIYIVDGEYELTVQADGAFAEDVFISISEYEEIDTTIELGVEKDIYATTTYNFTAPTNDAYLITIEAEGFANKDFQISMEEGPIFGDGSNRNGLTTYEFFGTANEPFSIGVYLYKSGTIKLTITKTYGDIVLDQETTVTLSTYSQAVKATFKVPYKGVYQLEITSDNVTPKQLYVSVEGKNPIIDDDHNTLVAEFSSEIGESYINFTNMAGSDFVGKEITFVVTLVRDVGNILPVGGSNTATIGGIDAPGKLVLEGAEAGNTYRLLVEWQSPFNKINVISLKYCEQVYNVVLVGDQDSKYYNHYYVEFEYVDGENDIEIYTNGTLIKNVVVKLEKVRMEAAAGPEVGDNIKVTPGTDTGSAVLLDFGVNFIAGGEYTLKITDTSGGNSDEAFMMYNYYLVDGSNAAKMFVKDDDWTHFYLTFTATGAEVKLYAEAMRYPPPAPVEILVTVTAAPAAEKEDNGLKIGESVTIDLSNQKTRIDLTSELVAGQKYIIEMSYSMWFANGGILVHNGSNQLTIVPNVATETMTAEFIAVAGENYIELYFGEDLTWSNFTVKLLSA